MTEPRDRNGHTATEYRAQAKENRYLAENHCDLRGNLPAIALLNERAKDCDFAAWELEATR